jgi:hypothetical protein
MTKSKKIIISLICLALLTLTFLAGGFVGFNNGYAFRVYHASIADSYYTMGTLETLKSGDITGAQRQLERLLDSQLMEHWSGLINKPLKFTFLPNDDETTNKLMSRVANYRKNNPRKNDDAKVEEAIQTVVCRYSK